MSRSTAALAAALVLACNNDVVLPSQGEPKLVSVVAGQAQQGAVAQPLTDSLVILVTDATGRPVSGQPISANLLSGGSVSPAGLQTDDAGRLAISWILGTVAGAQTLELGVGASGVISPKAVFSAEADPGPAKLLVILAGDDQVGEVGQPLADPLSVRVTDQYDNVVAGSGVTWTPAAGGVDPAHAVTGADGVAETAWTLGGAVGAQSAVAELDPAPGTTADFSATATPGPPPVLTILVQPPATARNGVPFAIQPVIQVGDAAGAPQATPGIPVTAAVASGNGVLGGTTTVATDAAGQAHFADLALTGKAGDYTLFFAAPGYLTASSNTVTLSSRGPSPSLSSISVIPTTLTAGVDQATVTVTVRDSAGGPITGLAVTLGASGAGNTLVQPSALSDAAGEVTGTFSSTVAETKDLQALVGSVALDQVAHVTVVAGPPDAGETDAQVGNGKPLRLTHITIQTRDAFGNRLTRGGFAAHLSVSVTGENTANPALTDNGDGTYSAQYLPLLKGTDSIAVTLDGVAIRGSPYQSKVK